MDLSINASASFPIEETSATQPYTFDTPNTNEYTLIQARWDSFPSFVSDGTEANRYPCVTPALTITTECAYADALPDGGMLFTGGVEGMLFEVYGPETRGGVFPSYEVIPTDATRGGGDGSLVAGSYKYAYVVPGREPGRIDGSFTIGTCPPPRAG